MSLKPSLLSIIKDEMEADLNHRHHIIRVHHRDKDPHNRPLKEGRAVVETRAVEAETTVLPGFSICRIPQSVSSRSDLQGPVLVI